MITAVLLIIIRLTEASSKKKDDPLMNEDVVESPGEASNVSVSTAQSVPFHSNYGTIELSPQPFVVNSDSNGILNLRNAYSNQWVAIRILTNNDELNIHPTKFLLPPGRISAAEVTMANYDVVNEELPSRILIQWYTIGAYCPARNVDTLWTRPYYVPRDQWHYKIIRIYPVTEIAQPRLISAPHSHECDLRVVMILGSRCLIFYDRSMPQRTAISEMSTENLNLSMSMDLVTVLLGFLASCIPIAISCLYLLSWVTPWPVRTRKDLLQPMFVYTPANSASEQFRSLLTHDSDDACGELHCTKPDLYLSVIIPAMNEQERLPIMLNECLPYLEDRQAENDSFSYEIIVVDDGSTDRTANTAYQYTEKYEGKIRVLKLKKNLGKGGAVRRGVLCARGSLILFADADGATKFADFQHVEKELLGCISDGCISEIKANVNWIIPVIAIGSRSHMEQKSIATRSLARTFLMIGFHLIVYIFTVRTVRDTQCGFKLFTRGAVSKLFPLLHVERWAFDVELLFLAEQFNIPICEVPVTWHEVDGSKIVPIISWIEMGRDLILIWFRYKTDPCFLDAVHFSYVIALSEGCLILPVTFLRILKTDCLLCFTFHFYGLSVHGLTFGLLLMKYCLMKYINEVLLLIFSFTEQLTTFSTTQGSS
uniref:dolichyl-phosphate beta-glucosyltransferase n=1 Tax=Loa loa TaxID=7209 RepID=A0A1I7VR46_LOALO